MKRAIIIIIVIIVLVAIAGLVVYIFLKPAAAPSGTAGGGLGSPSYPLTSGGSPSSNPPAPATTTDEGPIPQGTTFSVQTPSGVVTVNNFFEGKNIDQEEPSVLVASTSTYDIWYLRGDGSFEIDLPATASSADRTSAENTLVAALGVSQLDACKLSVTVYQSVDNGSDYGPLGGLSFCAPAQGGGFQGEQFNVE